MDFSVIKWLSILSAAALGQLCGTVWFASDINTTMNTHTKELYHLMKKDEFNTSSLIVTSTKLEIYEKKLNKVDEKLDRIWDKLNK